MSLSSRITLFGVIYFALFCTGLLAPPEIWAQLLCMITFLTVWLITIGAMFGPPDRRAVRGGFALSAALYLAVTVYPGSFTGFPSTKLIGWLNAQLIGVRVQWWSTQHELDAAKKAPPEAHEAKANATPPATDDVQWAGFAVDGTAVSARVSSLLVTSITQDTPRMVHCLIALLLGLAGSIAARVTANMPS